MTLPCHMEREGKHSKIEMNVLKRSEKKEDEERKRKNGKEEKKKGQRERENESNNKKEKKRREKTIFLRVRERVRACNCHLTSRLRDTNSERSC